MKLIKETDFQFKLTPKVDRAAHAFETIRATVLSAIDASVQNGDVAIGKQEKLDALSTDTASTPKVTYEPQINVAIGALQATFRQSGISMAVCGEDHTYRDGKPQVEPLSGLDQSMKQLIKNGETEGFHPRELLPFQKKFAARKAEKRNLAPKIARWERSILDRDRGDLLAELAAGAETIPKPDLVVLERGLKYQGPLDETIFEEAISGPADTGWSIRQRSALIAGYIFLCAAGGDQTANDRVLVFFGEEHAADILDFFEFFALRSSQIPWVRKRTRHYSLIPSHVH